MAIPRSERLNLLCSRPPSSPALTSPGRSARSSPSSGFLPSRRRPFLSPFFILPLHLPTFCVLVRFILLFLLRPRTTYFHTTTYYLLLLSYQLPIFTIHCPRTLPETSLHLFPQTRLNWVCPRFSSAFRLIFCLGASVARTHSSVFFPVAYPLDFFLSFFTSTSAELHQHHGHWLL